MDARSVLLMLALMLIVAGASAAAVDPLDGLETLGYQPLAVVSGTVRLAGSTTLQQAAALWAEGFTAIHPDVVVAIDSTGSDAGWKALLAGTADAALLSRPVAELDRKAFAEAAGAANRKLVVVPVGFERLVWIVHAANPIAELRWSPDTGVIGPAAAPLRVHATELGSGTLWHLDRLLTGTTAVPIGVQTLPLAIPADATPPHSVRPPHGWRCVERC
jgi:DNA-binding transcriptional LysR family regulator